MAWIGIGILSDSVSAAVVSFSTSVPAVGDGVQNLNFSTDDASNTQVQYVENDYLAVDNTAAVGQTFTTGSNADGYSLNAISVRQVSWGDTYWDYTGGSVTLQIFRLDNQQGNGVGEITALALETAVVGGEDDGVTYSGGTPGAAARWLTVTLGSAVYLDADTIYGFQLISSGSGVNDQFFIQLDGTSTDSYAGGFATGTGKVGGTEIDSGSIWDGGNGQPSDRAFVASMTALAGIPPFYPIEVSPVGGGGISPVRLEAVIEDWGTTFSNAVLYLDGSPVSIDYSNTVSGVTTIRSVEFNLAPGTAHDGKVVVTGTSGEAVTNEWIFVMADYLTLSNEVYVAGTLTNSIVTVEANTEIRLSNDDSPIDGSVLDLQSTDSWVFLTAVKPSVVDGWLDQIKVNGVPAVNNLNVRLVQYGQGTVVIPYPSDFQPMEVFDGENFTGNSMALSPNTAYGNVLDGKVSSFILKRGYTATLASGEGGTGGVNYVAADGDLKIGALSDGLNDNVNFIRIFPWRWVTKKGTCDKDPVTFNAKWNYNWNLNSPSTLDREYVAIRQERWWPGLNQDWGWWGVNHLLGYNEPDNDPDGDGQDTLSVGDAIWSWPDLEWTGLRIGAPAVTDGGFYWITDFMDAAEAAGRRVDYIPIHYYRASNNNPASAASALYTYLKAVYDIYHKPMWVTEFNNGANWTGGTDPTFAQNRDCIEAMINMMDAAPWVERYSIYGAVEEARELIDWSGNITPMGAMYRDHESPIAYQQIIPGEGMDPSASYNFENSLDDSSGSGNHAVSHDYPDFVAGHGGGSALQLDGVNDHVILPSSLSDSTDFTFAAWIYWYGGGEAWQRIFDFGIVESGSYMFLTPDAGGAGLRFGINKNWSGEQQLNAGVFSPNTWNHVAVTLNGNTGRLYLNGTQVSSGSITVNPADLDAIQHYLGRSMFVSDPCFHGEIDDVIIRDYALSSVQVAALAAGNLAPQVMINEIDGGTLLPGEAYYGSIAGAATDPDGGSITYSKVYGPGWLNVASDGTLTGTPGAEAGGPQYFTLRAADDAGAAASIYLYIDLPRPAGVYIGTTTDPVPDADDIYQFGAASTDGGNVDGGADAATYMAHTPSRGALGQFFTTGAASGLKLTSVWLRHVPYGPTSSALNAGDTFTVRIVDPSQINTAGFVIYSELLTVTADDISVSSGTGSGKWVEFKLGVPVPLQPDTTYGFDVGCGSDGGEYWEISGVSDDVHAGGSAYMSGSYGTGNNGANVYDGDRTFLVKLTAPGGPPGGPPLVLTVPSGGPVTISWPKDFGNGFNVLTNSDLMNSNGWANAGLVPYLDGDSFVVTNSVGNASSLFYMLEAN